LVSKITDSNSDFVYLSVQNPDSSFTLIKQLKEHNKNIIIFGNDAVGNTGLITKNQELYSGIVFGTIKFDLNNEKTKLFVSNYKNKFNVDVPYGVWTAESYDAVYVIANALKKCDNNSDCIKSYLYNLKDSEGASGKLSIDSNGDGIREYQLKIVTSSGIQDLN
jgi:ABC-type branched-subunit amino acid transport system substrate-binding protein